MLYLYRQAFNYFKMGYASAMAWFLFIVIVILTVIQFRLSSGRWHYGSDRTADVQSNVAGQEQRSQFSAYRCCVCWKQSLRYVILVIGVLAFIFPFYWLIITSIKSNADCLSGRPR